MIKRILIFKVIIFLLIPNLALAVGKGSRLPSVTLPMLSNPAKKVNVANIRAKYLLIDFWASWCAPCRSSMGTISRLARSERGKGLRVIGINLDKDRTKALQFLKRYPASFSQLSDTNGSGARRLGLPKVPSYYLIGPDKRVIAIFKGYRKSHIKKIKSLIK